MAALRGQHHREHDALLRTHWRWIQVLARRTAAGRGSCLEDLQQVGQLGLLKAAERYRPALGVPFTAFARRHIRGAMQHYLRDQWPLIRIPRLQQERMQALARSQHLQLSDEQWQQLRQARQSSWPLALDPADLDRCAASSVEVDVAGQGEAQRWLAWLEPGQARVLQLVVLEGMSLRQTAKLMQSNASAVRRQLKAGLAELRTRLSPASDVAGC